MALDPEPRLVVAAVPGARTEEDARAIVAEVRRRAGGEPPPLMTGDEYPAYAAAIEGIVSEPVPAPARRTPGRPRVVPERRLPDDVAYATVPKHREGDRVVAVERRQVFGTPEAPEDAPGESAASRRVSTSFVGRQDATGRGRDAREARETYRFSKGWRVHEAMTDSTLDSYDFRRCVRTPRREGRRGHDRRRSPAVAAGLTDHVWTGPEWFNRPTVQST